MLLFFTLISFFLFNSAHASDCEIEIKGHDICAHVQWERGPVWGGFSKAQITYHKKESPENLVDLPDELKVYIWMIMDQMEHGGGEPSVSKEETGVYSVDRLQFTKMSDGFWELRWRDKSTSKRSEPLARYRVPLGE